MHSEHLFFFSSHTVLFRDAKANISHSLSIWCAAQAISVKPTAACRNSMTGGQSWLQALSSSTSLCLLALALNIGRLAFAFVLQHLTSSTSINIGTCTQHSRSFRGAAGGATIRMWPFVFSLLFFLPPSPSFFSPRLAIRQTMKGWTPRTQTGLLFQSVDKCWEQMHVHVSD